MIIFQQIYIHIYQIDVQQFFIKQHTILQNIVIYSSSSPTSSTSARLKP
jgi:hypothetical protein